MKTSNILTVISVSEPKKDKNKRTYKTVKLQTSTTKEVTITGGAVVLAKVQPRVGTLNVYEESYLDNKAQFGFDFAVGDIILGDVVTQKVEPYAIPNTRTGEITTQNTYSCIVLGDSASSSWDTFVAKAFASNDKIIDLNLVGATVATPVPMA